MSIFNRRNAALGWAAWTVAKWFAEQKARAAVRAENGRSKKKLFLAALAAVGAAVFFWRRNAEGDQPPDAGTAP